MDSSDWLADQFSAQRSRLHAVATRMLGSSSEAEDAVQEAWLRLSRSDAAEIENLAGWLTTVVSRICLNMLQSRQARREAPLSESLDDSSVATLSAGTAAGPTPSPDPATQAELADSVGSALLVVLDTLTPAERLAFVLHDLFAVSFDEVAEIVGRSPAASRQLASRARRRVQGAFTGPDRARHREIVRAFLAASRGGDFDALLALLDPDVVVRPDQAAQRMGGDAGTDVRGRQAVAQFFAGRARAARPALIDGAAGLVWMHRGEVRVVFDFTVVDDQIATIELLAAPELLAELDVELLAP